jgi:hypothetical protein
MARNLTTGLQRGLRRSIAGGLGANDLFSIAPLDLRFAQQKTLDPRVTFTRASSGTYVDSEGVIRTATTNLLLRSEEFDNASWLKNGTPTVTANSSVAPDGTTTAELFTRTTTDPTYIRQLVVKAASALTYTFSVYAKQSVGNFIALRAQGLYPARAEVVFNLSTGAIASAASALGGFASASATITSLLDGWYRLTLTATTDAVTNITAVVSVNSNGGQIDGTDSVSNSACFLWGAQLEQSSTVGEYIPTTSTINSAPRFDHDPTTGESLGLLVEEARTNEVRSSSMTGGATGTPGTYPTGLSTNNIATGLTLQIAALGADAGVAYVDIRVSGTTTNANGFSISLQPAADAVASSGQTWTGSCYCSLVAGSYSNITAPRLRILERTAVGGYLTEGSGVAITATGTSILQARATVTRTIANALTARAQLGFVVGIASGVAVDFTFRFAAPQLELGAFPTSYIPTTTAAATRAADVASISGSNFSSWYRQDSGSWYCSATSLVFDSNERGLFGIDTGSFARGYHAATSSPTRIRTRRRDATNTIATDATLSAGTSARVALVATSTEQATTYNGGAVITNATALTLDPITDLRIGYQNITGSPANLYLCGCLSRLTYWPQRLPNDTLQTITV